MPTYTYLGDGSFLIEGVNGERLNVKRGESFSTFKILGAPFVKTSDEPFFSLTKVNVNFTSPGTQSGLLGCNVIRLTAKATGITIKCNVVANTNVFALPANTSIDIKNDGEIESLIFIGDGAVTIEGF